MMRIGIDLTPLQGPHRLRGVGSTVINVLLNIPNDAKSHHSYVFYLYENAKDETLELINAKSFPDHTVIIVPPAPGFPPSIKTIRGLLHAPIRAYRMIRTHSFGSKRLGSMGDVDVYLQFEQDAPLPRRSGLKRVVIAYDLIPYILEQDYLWSYKTARVQHGYSRRGAILAQLKRWRYISNIRAVMNSADKILAISHHTKKDLVRYAHTDPKKISVCHLGVSHPTSTKPNEKPSSVASYVESSWGNIQKNIPLPSEPFLLFIGGIDPRRKVTDLVAAFNLLRAQGHKIKLVLAGDTMFGASSLPNAEARKAFLSSSYLDDIIFLGFINEVTKNWLYENTLALVYPSRYEGFGLPVLEAMRFGTPVITYDNSSIREISGDAALYADGHISISERAGLLLNKDFLHKYKSAGIAQSKLYSWGKTSRRIIEEITEHE